VARKSPPTERVVRVLNIVADTPRHAFTLSELARHSGITKATCLGIVGSLTDAGYLVREPGKTYRIGPALLTLGQAAQDGVAALELARPHLRRLTEDLGLSCTASVVLGDEIVVLERTGLPGTIDSAVKVGQRYPYAPPSGVVFAVWQPDQVIEHWLRTHPPVPIDRQRLQQLAQSCRRTGILVEQLSEVSVASYTLLAGISAASPPAMAQALQEIVAAFPYRYFVDDDLCGTDPLPVSLICSPTYGAQGLPELLLAVLVLGPATPARVEETGAVLRTAAAAVTEQIGGRDPWAAARTARRL